MRFNQELSVSNYSIRACETDGIRVVFPRGSNQEEGLRIELLSESFILTPNELISPWAPRSLAELQSEHLSLVADLDPEVVILGTGARQGFPAQAISMDLMRRGIGMEVMDNAAACRTFNILMHEGRRVAAALIQ